MVNIMENPYEQMDDLGGKPTILRKHTNMMPMLVVKQQQNGELFFWDGFLRDQSNIKTMGSSEGWIFFPCA